MANRRCFVQFSHPGTEHGPMTGQNWRSAMHDHRRKFMHLCGTWIERDQTKRFGNLWAWGEWEPQSMQIRKFSLSGGNSRFPRILWEPYYVRRNNYRGLHNTDPFIFGDRFLYSNCGQGSSNKAGLKHLAPGSVIAFGSGKEVDGTRKWMLDTVLVVKDFVEYDMRRVREDLKDWVPDTFLDVTGGPLADYDENMSCSGTCLPNDGQLRLYRGATPDDSICGMFSFFPAAPADGETGFPRPLIDLPDKYFNPGSWQTAKGISCHCSYDELHDLWERLVGQVHDAGLVLGTHAELPECRLYGG